MTSIEKNRRTIFSFIVDDDPIFVYEGWHLARSLIEHCGGDPSAIVVQCTPEVSTNRREIFRGLGCQVRQIARFGDGRHCNKLGQIDNLRGLDFDNLVLLDTDTIAVADLRPFLDNQSIQSKIVDGPNPPLAKLAELAASSGFLGQSAVVTTDNGDAETYFGNCNGGFYSIPKFYAETLSLNWRRWALWLLEHIEPLQQSGHAQHVDQVSFWLAVQHLHLPFTLAPANVNYYVHMEGAHHYFDPRRPLALLHYHTPRLDVLGRIIAQPDVNPACAATVERANAQIALGFDNRVFWDWRYRHFPERGSGVGSRGDNLLYKRQILKEHGIEIAASVLDFGCGDIEVVKALNISNYLGVDLSPQAIEIARLARPDWQFHLAPPQDVPPADLVLCFEVLIHQETRAAYDTLISTLAAKTRGSLLVSGYAAVEDAVGANPMLFFHEPLAASLERTRRFKQIREVGRHTDVVIYRCDV